MGHVERVSGLIGQIMKWLYLAGFLSSACWAAQVQAMLPSQCSVYGHWSRAASLSSLEGQEASTVVRRLDTDMTGDGRPELFVGTAKGAPPTPEFELHVYTLLESGDGVAYLGVLTVAELYRPDGSAELVVLRRDAQSDQLAREVFEVTSEGLRSLAKSEPGIAVGEESLEQARAWRAANEVTIWQASLKAVSEHAQSDVPITWHDSHSDRTRLGDDGVFNLPVRYDKAGIKSPATHGCLWE